MNKPISKKLGMESKYKTSMVNGEVVKELQSQRDELLESIISLHSIHSHNIVAMMKWWESTFERIERITGLSMKEIRDKIYE